MRGTNRAPPLLPMVAAMAIGSIPARPTVARADGAAPRVSVSVVIAGGDRVAPRVSASVASLRGMPVTLRIAPLPSRVASEPARDVAGDVEARLAASRHDYVDAEFGRCVERLDTAASGEPLVRTLLAAGLRTAAARVLFWRASCRVGAGLAQDAAREARSLAVYGLEVPADVESVSPEVDRVVAGAIDEVRRAGRVPLEVRATTARASVSIDGRNAICFTPCTVDVARGDHVLSVEADGKAPEVRVVRVEGPGGRAGFDPPPAAPAVAARQWATRYASPALLESAPSLRLLAQAERARRLVLLVASEEQGGALRVRGALTVDGAIASRAERLATGRASEPAEVEDLMRDLLVRGRVVEPAPPLVERPLFWVAIGIAAALAAAATAVILYEPDVRSSVSF